MTAQAATRSIAGVFILLSLFLAHLGGQADLTRPGWLWLTAFVGLNLFQSGLSGWCLMTNLLRKLGLRSA